MANIRKISELEKINALSVSSNVIIEEDGKAKRFNANNIGKVKTVNGIEPDVNGNIEIEIPELEIPEIDYPVTSVNGMTGDVVIESGLGGVSMQADWSQNDENAVDYVKGRTHWVEDNYISILTELIDFDFINDGDKVSDGVYCHTIGNIELNLDTGKKYLVIWNGTQYELTCHSKSWTNDTNSGRDYYLGNAKLLQNLNVNDDIYSDVPFCVYKTVWDYPNQISAVGAYMLGEEPIAVTVNILESNGLLYHALNENFIPDSIARVRDIPTGGLQSDWNQNDDTSTEYIKNRPFYENIVTNVARSLTTEDFGNVIGNEPAVWNESIPSYRNKGYGFNHYWPENKVYCVEFDGVMYEPETVKMSADGNWLYVGNPAFVDDNSKNGEDNGLPYAIIQNTMYDSMGYVIVGDTGVHTVALYEVVSYDIKQIDEKFIPDTIARTSQLGGSGGSSVQPDLAQNDESAPDFVKNRTHYSEGIQQVELLNMESMIVYNYDYFYGDFLQLSLDRTYKVIFDGVIYECIPHPLNYWLEDGIAIGNSSLIGNIEDLNKSEPFVFYYSPSDDYGYFGFKEYGVEHTVSIYSIIDEDEIAILEEEVFDTRGWAAYSDSLLVKITSVGEVYEVEVNGHIYTLTSKYLSFDRIVIAV